MTDDKRGKKRWFPLESNPDVMNKYIQSMGADTSKFQYCDVYGLDEEMLGMVPSPVLAVLLLFPITDENSAYRKTKAEESKGKAADVYFMKQFVSNACGTIGLFHSVLNNRDRLSFTPGAFLEKFAEQTASLTPEGRGHFLEESDEVEEVHTESAQDGQSNLEPIDTPVNLHFVCFVERNGRLYEFDGCEDSPIDHGASSPATLLSDVAKYVQGLLECNPDTCQFNMIALAAATE